MTYNKRDIERLLRTAFGGPRNDECGEGCGESAILSTKRVESLPLRQILQLLAGGKICPEAYLKIIEQSERIFKCLGKGLTIKTITRQGAKSAIVIDLI